MFTILMAPLSPQGGVPVHLLYQSSEFHLPSNTGKNSNRKSGQAELIKQTGRMFKNKGGMGWELGRPLFQDLLTGDGEIRLETDVRMAPCMIHAHRPNMPLLRGSRQKGHELENSLNKARKEKAGTGG